MLWKLLAGSVSFHSFCLEFSVFMVAVHFEACIIRNAVIVNAIILERLRINNISCLEWFIMASAYM